jgi:transcriptional regulator with GAF, ATPase, and Fis domain
MGRFELADKGTIFLDEIGELPLDLQSAAARVQEGNSSGSAGRNLQERASHRGDEPGP